MAKPEQERGRLVEDQRGARADAGLSSRPNVSYGRRKWTVEREGEVARSALKSPRLHARCPRSSTAVGGVEVGPSAAAALRVGWSEL